MPPRSFLVVAVAAVLLFFSCGGESDPATPEGPNVLLITLDTTRRDRLGCYGYDEAVTPRIDALATSGVRFENAFAPVPFTLPSHATLLTGIHPAGHGLRINYSGSVALSEEVQTLAEVLAGRGYRCGAFIAARVLDAPCGLSRGFEAYSDMTGQPKRENEELEQVHRRGDFVCNDALHWLRQDDLGPFFTWVHFFDAHDPYLPPPDFEDVGADRYDGEIAFVDTQVGRLLNWLDEAGIREETLVVLAADHGEGLGEHGEQTHGLFVYDTTVRVPLIVSHPGRVVAGHVASELVGLVDVMPTVLAQLDIAPPPEVEGRDLSLALSGTALAEAPLYFESEYAMRTMHWAPLYGWIEYPWKYTEAPDEELFQLDEDPRELQNLLEEHPEIAGRLREKLRAFREAAEVRSASKAAVVRDGQRQLAMLGYLGAGAELPEDTDLGNLRDPRDAHQIYWETKRAGLLVDAGQHEDALAILEPLAELSPESTRIWSLIGNARLQLGRWIKAEEALRRSLEGRPDAAQGLQMLGDSLRGQGRIDEAMEMYQRAVEVDPDLGQSHSRLGLLQSQRGELDAALASFRRFVELEPDSPSAHCNLAGVLMQKGRVDESLSELRTALRLDPRCRPAHQGLGQVLQASGRRAEAIAARRTTIEMFPDDTDSIAALAWLLATSRAPELREPAKALELAEAAFRQNPANPLCADALAAAQACSGNFAAARATIEGALAAGRGRIPPRQVQRLEARLALYRQDRAILE